MLQTKILFLDEEFIQTVIQGIWSNFRNTSFISKLKEFIKLLNNIT